jgi:hypothetical protein
LFTSMMTRPAINASTAKLLNVAWTMAPWFFWVAVWVGCRIRTASVTARRPAEFRRGWAEKRIKGFMKTLAQTEETNKRTPAWARIPVPRC